MSISVYLCISVMTQMGGASGCGWTVAVLSGVGSHDDLSPNANVSSLLLFFSVVRRGNLFSPFCLFFWHALLTAFVSLALAVALSQVVIDTIDDLESVLHLISWE